MSTAGSGFWMVGKSLRLFPSWNLRLFRHQLGRYEQIEIGNDIPSGDNEVHEHVLLNGPRRISTDTNGALRLSGHCYVY